MQQNRSSDELEVDEVKPRTMSQTSFSEEVLKPRALSNAELPEAWETESVRSERLGSIRYMCTSYIII